MHVVDVRMFCDAACIDCDWRSDSEVEATEHVQGGHAVVVRQSFVQVYRP